MTHRIVIVGGGAGGLELATKLGNRLGQRLGRKGLAHITLIEKARTHFWKPHLHEIAAGSTDLHTRSVDYLAQSHWHGFVYRMGEMVGLDRQRREVLVAPYVDELEGEQVTGQRVFAYDTLVMAVGSQSNDFGTPGVQEHAMLLETPAQAERFHRRLVNACLRAQAQSQPLQSGQLQVAVIGAGATGVELVAELHKATRTLVSYGLDRINPERDIRLTLIEAGPRILPALPERVSSAALSLLESLHAQVRTNALVTRVTANSVELASGDSIPAELIVWAAGVKAPDFLRGLDGLEVNKINQLVVGPTLQTSQDERIYALGDCAAAPWLGKAPGTCVPPRAQAAHQQATHLAINIESGLRGIPPTPWTYRDFGSLVSLGEYSAVGNLMGGLLGKNLWVEGLFARWMYLSLYKMHELALHGPWKTGLSTAARALARSTEPRVKLH
jgi:NADH:ubiquinone reductase (H+-translocating)